MTAPVQVWLDGPDVYVSDIAGTPRPIATGAIKALARRANQRDDSQVKYGPDWFHRDALLTAAELVDTADQCTHEDKWTRCDNPANNYLTQPRPRCATHRVEN